MDAEQIEIVFQRFDANKDGRLRNEADNKKKGEKYENLRCAEFVR